MCVAHALHQPQQPAGAPAKRSSALCPATCSATCIQTNKQVVSLGLAATTQWHWTPCCQPTHLQQELRVSCHRGIRQGSIAAHTLPTAATHLAAQAECFSTTPHSAPCTWGQVVSGTRISSPPATAAASSSTPANKHTPRTCPEPATARALQLQQHTHSDTSTVTIPHRCIHHHRYQSSKLPKSFSAALLGAAACAAATGPRGGLTLRLEKAAYLMPTGPPPPAAAAGAAAVVGGGGEAAVGGAAPGGGVDPPATAAAPMAAVWWSDTAVAATVLYTQHPHNPLQATPQKHTLPLLHTAL
jgi:hypothetical protein